ncbi:MAG: polysulfide reductase NrfD [Chloroflexi bacterium]|nr:polysulfide reductase NrfD [Chloroflexota bacterium]
MPEITISSVNAITFPEIITWRWEVALYLFLGGLVAGLMIYGGILRLAHTRHFPQGAIISDLSPLPLLILGLLLLWLDLSNRWNFWRLYISFQPRSAMSWGSWILLFSGCVLALRLLTYLPAPAGETPKHLSSDPLPRRFIGQTWKAVHWIWRKVAGFGAVIPKWENALAWVGIILGTGVGAYTGVLLSTIPARPLWNSSMLPFLFLVSGLAGGGAFLYLFLPEEERRRMVPLSLALCGVELILIIAFTASLAMGSEASQRAIALLFYGVFGWTFWGLVVGLGLLLPAGVEGLEVMHWRVPGIPTQLPPILKLAGGMALRLVIVYAGLQSFL